MSELNPLDKNKVPNLDMESVDGTNVDSLTESEAAYARLLSEKIETIEQAQALVESILSLLENDEGDGKEEKIAEALDFFIAERNRMISEKAEYSESVSQIFAEAVEKMRQMANKEGLESAKDIIFEKVLRAKENILRGRLMSAIPFLHTALKDAAHKEYWSDSENDEQKAEIESLLVLVKEQWIAGGRKIDR